ncbi:MAG: hypothetical protein GF332_00870 [Candidatus Moranbacteria bacterium]|nr:hypothetical protein [Candidatus Moranbacteria bacterium]
MPDLKKLKDELYSRQGSVRSRPGYRSDINPKIKKPADLQREELIKKMKLKKGNETTRRQKKLFLMFLGGIVIMIGFLIAGYSFYVYQKSLFSEENILLQVNAPDHVESGEIFKFNVLYHNNNSVPVENATLKINFKKNLEITRTFQDYQDIGKDFIIFDLGAVKAGENNSFEFEGKIIEKEKSTNYIKSLLVYNYKKREYSKSDNRGINVSATKITLQFEATRQETSGNLIEYYIKIKNSSPQNISESELRLTYPENFQFSASSINSVNTENTVFKLPTLVPDEIYEVTIKGTLEGHSAQIKKARAQVGLPNGDEFSILAEETAQTEIVTSPLIINQELSSQAVDPGEQIQITINYQNTSDLTMNDTIVTVDFDGGEAVDYGSISASNGGVYNYDKKRITWRGGELKMLKPQASGQFTYNIRSASKLPSKDLGDKNFTITVVAQIDSPDVPTPVGVNKLISSSKQVIKLNSKVYFETSGFYNDNVIANNGPIPPRVGEKTTYTIHWKITNINNDLDEVVIRSTLPGYVEWEDTTYPYDVKGLSYNDRTKEIVWNTGKVAAFSGTQFDAKELIFQISITPQENQIGQTLTLLNQSSFHAKDVFTDRVYDFINPEINTVLESDSSLDNNDGVIQRAF